jgi:hypothetical protein
MPAINVFAAPEALVSPTLRSVTLSGITPDGGDDKDNDSKLKITLFVDFGGGFVQTVASTDFAAYDRFADGDPWGPINVPVRGSFTLDNVPRLRATLEFQPIGDDTWKFNYTLNMTFSDGTVISKSGNNAEVSDGRRVIPL